MKSADLADLPDVAPRTLETEVTKFQHRLAETGLFTDENLVRVIDAHPRDFCNVSRMGTDSSEYEWGEGDTTGLSGEEILNAVRKGRLWINIRRLMRHQPEMRDVIQRLYRELERNCPEFKTSKHSANLLISSPKALVYYHLDVPQNMLWHIRGHKRVWVYPIDEHTLPHDIYESTVAGDPVEDLTYETSFDEAAQVFDLEPGDVVTWPQNAPHRMENYDDLNVSLSTEHYTDRQLRHVRVCKANRFLRRTTCLPCRSLRTEGIGYALKSTVFFGMRAVQKLFNQEGVAYHYPMTFRVDPNAPDGIRMLDKVPHSTRD